MIWTASELEKYELCDKEDCISHLKEYVLTDTVLFFSEKAELYARQKQCWQPYIAFFNAAVGTSFLPTKELLIPQSNQAQTTIFQQYLQGMFHKELVALYLAATELRSPILGFSLCKNQEYSTKQIVSAAFLEQKFQEEYWGTMENSAKKYEEIVINLAEIRKFLQK